MNKLETIFAIIGIVVIECVALSQGIDGIVLGGVVAVLAGLGGYKLREGDVLGKKETG